MSTPKTVLSIQSEVVTGHVGNAAARFAMQRLGLEVWALPTVLLSSHAGHPGFAGEATPSALFGRLLAALDAQGRLTAIDGVLSGYLGDAAQAPLLADVVSRIKASNETALYCLDPAFGDDGRIYARAGVAEAIGDTLLPLADVVRANAFELATLSGLPVDTPERAIEAARALRRPIVVVTTVPAGADRLAAVLVAEGEALIATTPRIIDPPHGAGDLFAALLFARMLSGSVVAVALERALQSTFQILSVSAGAPEMALVAEQDALVAPPALPTLRIETVELGSIRHG